MLVLENITIFIFLLYLAVEDIRKKSVSVRSIGVMLTLAFVYKFVKLLISMGVDSGITNLGKLVNYNDLIIGAICLIILFISSLCFKFIGLGDVCVFFILFVIKGGVYMATVLMLSLILLGISGVMMIVYKRISLKTSIPYIPYIFVCAMGVMACV